MKSLNGFVCPFQVGVLEDEYSCLGIFCAIAFFPLGLLCCLAMKQRVCPNCGAVFGWSYSSSITDVIWREDLSSEDHVLF